MLTKPRFKSYFHIETLESGTVCLLSEYGHYALEGAIYSLLVPWMDGKRTVTEIAKALAGQASLIQIQRALIRLEAHGYLVEGDADDLPPRASRLLGSNTSTRRGG